MKIGLVCHEFPPAPHGGIGTFVHGLAHGLAGKGHQVMVVGMAPEAGGRRDGTVQVVHLRACRIRGIAWLVNRWRLRRFLLSEWEAGRLHLVECPEYEGWLPFGLGRCPGVLRLHLARTTVARQAGRSVTGMIPWCERWTLKRNRRWIGVSRHALALIEETFGLRAGWAHLIYNPITPAASPGAVPPALPPEPFVLFAGALSARKGALVVAEAARHFLVQHPGLQLVYAGSDPGMDGQSSLSRIREVLGPDLAPRMHYLGLLSRNQVLAVMGRALAFLFPSTLETFGLTAGEAMLSGCPVIVSNQPPFTEFIVDGHNGLLVDPLDPSALAQAVSRLYLDPSLREELVRGGRATVGERFSLDACLQQTEAVYQEAILASGSAARGGWEWPVRDKR